MFHAGVVRIKQEKSLDGVARQVSNLQNEMKDFRVVIGEEGFARGLEELCVVCGKHLGLARKSKSVTANVKALGLAFCSLLIFIGKRGVRLGVVVPWEQGAVQAAVGCLLRFLNWQPLIVTATDVLRAVAFSTQERCYMLSKEVQDTLVTLCCKYVAPSNVAAVAVSESAGDEIIDEEDSRDSDGVIAAKPPFANVKSVTGECLAALQCLSSLAKAKRKSHFVETHFVRVGSVAFVQFAALAADVVRGGLGCEALILTLQLMEALIGSAGAVFASEFNARLHSLFLNLAALLFSSSIRSEDVGFSSADGFSSVSEGVSRLSSSDRLRVHVMLLLSGLAGSCYKQLSNDMLLLLPYSNVSRQALFFESSRSLYYFVVNDPNHRVRMHGLSLLLALLKPSRGFFSAAMDQQASKQTSFISFSQKLALTLRDVHAVLEIALSKEDDPANRQLLLRLVSQVSRRTSDSIMARRENLFLCRFCSASSR
jgi:hypothetical protein